jgi:hypothetical protein
MAPLRENQLPAANMVLHGELPQLRLDPLAVANRQTNLAGLSPHISLFNPQLLPLDFAKFIAPINRHRSFHRPLQEFCELHAPI